MAEKEKDLIISKEKLHQFALDCFLKTGFNQEHALLIADSLIEADLRGLNTHGVIRIPMYLKRVLSKLINPNPSIVLVQENTNTALLDGGNGMGQLVCSRGISIAIEKAGESSIGMVGIRNSNHFGTAAYYAMKAAQRGYIGIACSNTEPLMVAPGGAEEVAGNNPLAVAVPGGDSPGIVMDMAMSAAAIGKIVMAQKRGDEIPYGWATDQTGKPTKDPDQALNGGFLLPFAGPKGYSLSLIIDVLSGVLTGAGFGKNVYSPFHDFEHNQNLGHLMIAINPSVFLSADQFVSRVDELYHMVKSARTAEGTSEVYLPGEIEHQTKLKRIEEGIPLPKTLVYELNQFAEEIGATKLANSDIKF